MMITKFFSLLSVLILLIAGIRSTELQKSREVMNSQGNNNNDPQMKILFCTS
jgi:hypothetical protein